LAPGEAELKSRNQAACLIAGAPAGAPAPAGRAGGPPRHGLARGDGGDDEVGLRGEIGMGRRQRDAVGRGVIAQRIGLIAAELDVVGTDFDVLLAQVLGQDTAHFAIADEADIPLLRVDGQLSHGTISRFQSAAFSRTSASRALLLLDSSLLDHLLPLVDVGFQPRRNLRWHARPRFDAKLE
jgi:hypothetical protein